VGPPPPPGGGGGGTVRRGQRQSRDAVHLLQYG
jgi:hypothetical protein